MATHATTRRKFVKHVAGAAFGAVIVPRHVLGGPGFVPPSDRVNVAIIGAGLRGTIDATALVEGDQNIVAIADVDFPYVEASVERHMRQPIGPKIKAAYARAKHYSDFRQMLEDVPDIDAVLIATPDHLHAVIAKRAMEMGKHVYLEKPLAHTVHETRVLADTARRTGVVTQMGNQGRSSDDARRTYELIQAGVIGAVREVHIWTDSPRWPSALPRPDSEFGKPSGEVDWRRAMPQVLAGALGGPHPIPTSLNWDLFLGPAPEVPYHPIYHPRNWRGWTDWGVGALGDMGPHLLEPPVTALGLEYPTSVQAASTAWGGDPEDPVSYPAAMTAHYEFPAHGGRPPVDLHWYDGGLLPQRPAMLPDNVQLARTGGFFLGDDGILMYRSGVRVYPDALQEAAEKVPERYPRIGTSHEMNWIRAIRGETEATSPFSLAAPLTEVVLLGLTALRTGQGAKITYDPAAMSVTSHPDSDRFLRRQHYREGWAL